jgi:hypothetical protein
VPDTVLIDPEYWLISKDNTTAKVPDAIVGQNVVQVFPNPVSPTNFISIYETFVCNTAGISLFNAAGQLLFAQNITLLNASAVPADTLANNCRG